jgi:hypothetical protein
LKIEGRLGKEVGRRKKNRRRIKKNRIEFE